MTALHSTDSRFDSIVDAYTSTDALHREIESHEETRALLAEALLELERLRAEADPISALLSAARRLGSPAMVFVHRIARNPVTVSIHVDTDEQLRQLADTLRLSAVSAHRGEHSEWTEASRTTDAANVTVYGPQRRV